MDSDENIDKALSPEQNIESITSELSKDKASKKRRSIKIFVVASLSAIPWVGGVISAAASVKDDLKAQDEDDLRTQWLAEHQRKLVQLASTIDQITDRFESLGPEIDDRIQSPSYLAIVRQAFKAWDDAETDEKREFIANLIANSAGTNICNDDIVRLFVSWLDLYHESHFAVIRELHHNPGSTRYGIWDAVYGITVREDSAEADLYKMLIRDLSTGGVIRQHRQTTASGEFVRRKAAKKRSTPASTMKSAFDDNEQYVLTALGKQFVHYTLMGDIRRLEK